MHLGKESAVAARKQADWPGTNRSGHSQASLLPWLPGRNTSKNTSHGIPSGTAVRRRQVMNTLIKSATCYTCESQAVTALRIQSKEGMEADTHRQGAALLNELSCLVTTRLDPDPDRVLSPPSRCNRLAIAFCCCCHPSPNPARLLQCRPFSHRGASLCQLSCCSCCCSSGALRCCLQRADPFPFSTTRAWRCSGTQCNTRLKSRY